jgi:HPr kinase/phosphorylase
MPTFQSLYEDNREALRWSWIAGRDSSERLLDTPATAGLASADLVGHLNLIHPNRLHVLGEAEVADGAGATTALRP